MRSSGGWDSNLDHWKHNRHPELLAQFDETQLVDVRDHAIIAVMLYGFARVSSVTKMQVRDFDQDGTNAWFMLDEKDSQNRIPAHPQAAEWIAQYIAMAGIGDQSDTSLFRSIRGRNGKLSDRALLRSNVFMMIRRRNCAVGLPLELGCQSIRSAGIANYLTNGGILAHAAQIAGDASPKTTRRYDPRTVLMDTPDVNRMKF